MQININSINRKLLIKYPIFSSIIANLEFQPEHEISTVETDGKKILYNPKSIENLPTEEQVFLFAHAICHVAFNHIYRSEGKDKKIWNTATDAVINALLKQDGLPIIEGGVDIPEAVNYNAEEMYRKLLEEKEKNQQEKQRNSDRSNVQDNENSNFDNSLKEQDVGHDTHNLWEKVIEDRKKEQEKEGKMQETKECKKEQTESDEKNKTDDLDEQANDERSFAEKEEQEIFKQNAKERKKQLQKLSQELADKSSQQAGDETRRNGRILSDIGIALPLIDWRRLLRPAIKYDEEWSRKNARMKNGYFKHRIQQMPIPETEILLDTSGSVDEVLLKNFLKECKYILENSKVKVGCFNTEFHGFTEIKKIEDIDNMHFPIGGGTDFDVAVEAFSRRASNKIIFTDGKGDMPKKAVKNVIWVVFGDEKINPREGKVIYITGEKLEELYLLYENEDLQEKNHLI